MNNKKFLDQEGLKYLWSKILMENYPNNETLVAVLNAIDATKMDKNKIFIGTKNEYDLAYYNNEIPIGALVIILKEKPMYFTSLKDAINNINGTEELTDTAKIALYTNEDSKRKSFSLLSNLNIDETIELNESIDLDLNGYTIESTITPVIRTKAENVNLIANNGSIISNAPNGQKGTILSVMSGSLDVDGGTYISNTSGAGTPTDQTQCLYVYNDTSLSIKNATITSIDTNNGSVHGVTGKENSNITLEDCTVLVESGESMENRGIYSVGNITLKQCDIRAIADYTGNAAGTNYASNSRGVWCSGHLIMEDCYVDASHAGVTVQGTVYINGGSYNGYGHGGLYLAGSSGPHYFYNASFNWAPMQEGSIADTVAGTNGAGFYIGGKSDQVAYFDNCHFNTVDGTGHIYKNAQLPFYGIVMRTSGGEKNNIVYISNSDVMAATNVMFRGVGTSNMTVYNGNGNDWSKAAKVHNSNSTYFIDTTDTYEEVKV